MELFSDFDRTAGRFTLPISHLSWHATLPYLCISTDDGKLDVWWETKSETESKGVKAERNVPWSVEASIHEDQEKDPLYTVYTPCFLHVIHDYQLE